ncbi:membrane hypothetical protein [Candidatus Nitrospira nitrosa]|uniref:Uncharacterized protein n=1 Tax=Candidatus Nitrospira nitrosa TaxID=1742972 RepID=A0A0S4LAK1_9BACT|nr:hypothetical protein [Candidatus Nitrospira nitrosa]CUS33834.1 membrane hypothetical protein [Candidatus Nitrospira nitrosa]
MFKYELLHAFYADLRAHGFTVGVSEQMRVNHLLLQLHAADAFPESQMSLCNMLSSVLSTNDEQQRYFRQRFHHCFGAITSAKTSHAEAVWLTDLSLGADNAQIAKARIKTIRRETEYDARLFRAKMLVAMIATALLLVILPHVAMFFLIDNIITSSPLDEGRGPLKPMPPGDSKSSQHKSSGSVFGGNAQGWLSPLKMDVSSIPPPESWIGTGMLALTFLPFAVLALWAAIPSRRKDAFVNRRKTEGTAELKNLLLSAPMYNPFDQANVHRTIQGLRRPRKVESEDLDVDLTLDATLRNAGMFTPAYARHPVAPEYLILVERNSREDHVARYAESLVSVLKRSQAYSDVFYFEGDFRRVFRSSDSPRIAIEELVGRYRAHRLILITNGNGLIDPVSGKVWEWAAAVAQFERRICLTPTSPGLWGYREASISTLLEIAILPLLPESMELVVQMLTSDQVDLSHKVWEPPASSERREDLNRLADLLEDRRNLWLSSSRPAENSLRAMEVAARSALTLDGYRWLAACSVYPELNWNLTLYIGSTLKGDDGVPLIGPKRLLLLAMLPWFREGSMPIWLRLHLASSMSPSELRQVRALVSKLLLSIFEFAGKTVPLQLAMEHGQLGSRHDSDAESVELEDSLLAEFLSKPPRSDQGLFKLPAAIAKYLRTGRIPKIMRRATPDTTVQETRANAEALTATLKHAGVDSVTVLRGAHAELGEQAGYRPVQSFIKRDGDQIILRDEYFLFLPTDSLTGRLLDVETVTILLHRTRLVTRMALLNLVLMSVSAFYFSENILNLYNNDAISVGIICSWILLPSSLLNFLVLHRFKNCLRHFPIFGPINGVRHKATQFKLVTNQPNG